MLARAATGLLRTLFVNIECLWDFKAGHLRVCERVSGRSGASAFCRGPCRAVYAVGTLVRRRRNGSSRRSYGAVYAIRAPAS